MWGWPSDMPPCPPPSKWCGMWGCPPSDSPTPLLPLPPSPLQVMGGGGGVPLQVTFNLLTQLLRHVIMCVLHCKSTVCNKLIYTVHAVSQVIDWVPGGWGLVKVICLIAYVSQRGKWGSCLHVSLGWVCHCVCARVRVCVCFICLCI